MARRDLRCDPTAPGAARLLPDGRGAIGGPFGAGLFLLFSERFRFVCGYDQRRIAGQWSPHPLSRQLVTGRKCIPWMHHPYVPHAILQRGDDCDWLLVMGTFGPRHDWGDGSEENFPQYGIRKTARDRAGRIWEDGIALELLAECDGRRIALADLPWSFRHEPGLLELNAAAGSIARVELLAPAGTCGMRVRITRAGRGAGVGTWRVFARARLLAKRLTVAPLEHDAPIDVLDAPFGFQKFVDHRLVQATRDDGVAFAIEGLDATLAFVSEPRPARATVTRTDPEREEFARAANEGRAASSSSCFDVELEIDGGGRESIDLAVAVEEPGRSRARAVLESPVRATQVDVEGEARAASLVLDTGDAWLDGLWRWSRNVAHSLVAPNRMIMTGALGYSAKCHVGQDIPFVFPLFVLDPHPRLRAAAERTLRAVVESPSANDGRGILDHPCEGRDFAFAPMRPASARLWKRFGAAGLFRWILCCERHLAAGGDVALSRRAYGLFADKVRAHYLPFAPDRECWSSGEETQEPAYSFTTGYAALGALARLATHFGDDRFGSELSAARTALREHLEKPWREGGLRLTEACTRGDATLAAGWIVQRSSLERDPPWFGFDLPLVGAHALVHGALSEGPERELAALLADPAGTFRVDGAGLAKSPGGLKGVWHWHNGLAALGLARAGRIDAADELLSSIARGIADINGIGIPGEETNGGDYAMGIGALAGLCLLETLLGIETDGARTRLRPRLPSRLDGFVVERVVLAGRARRVEVARRASGPFVAREAREVAESDDVLTFELS